MAIHFRQPIVAAYDKSHQSRSNKDSRKCQEEEEEERGGRRANLVH